MSTRTKRYRPFSVAKVMIVLVLLGYPLRVFCTAPLPCAIASASPDGKILVVNDLLGALLNPDQKGIVKSADLIVLPYSFDEHTESDRVPGRMWRALPSWRVTLTSDPDHPSVGCPKVVITNDGKTMVVIDARPGTSFLWVFRAKSSGRQSVKEERSRGELIRKIPSRSFGQTPKREDLRTSLATQVTHLVHRLNFPLTNISYSARVVMAR